MKRALAVVSAGVALALAIASPRSEANPLFELNIGSLAPKYSPWWKTLDKMEKQIEADSGGRINVIIRPAGVMSEVEMVRETRKGERLQGCGVTTAAIAEGGNVPQLQLVELPYLFRNNVEADYVLDSVLTQPVSDLLARRGFTFVVWSENGWRSFATRGKPIKTPADLKAFKMRSQESDVHMAMWNAFGAQAVQKPMTETLPALQSSVIDGLDNTPIYLQLGGFGEPLDYLTMSNHIYQPAAVILSRTWFEALPADLKEVVLKPKALAAEARQLVRAENDAILPTLGEEMQVVELSEAERQAFVTAALPVHQSFAATVEGGPDFLNKINAALAEKRK